MKRNLTKWIAACAAATFAAACGAQTVTTNCAKKHLDEYNAARDAKR